MREQVEILEYQSEILFDIFQALLIRIDRLSLRVCLRGIFPKVNKIAAVHGFQQSRTAQKRRLAGAGGPNNRNNLPFRNRKGNILQHFIIAKFFIAVVNLQNLHKYALLS